MEAEMSAEVEIGATSAPLQSSGARIRRIRTICLPWLPNVLWVEVESDDGVVGLGETFFGSEAVTAYLHESAAPSLIGADSLSIAELWLALQRQWGCSGIGAEARGASAMDIALWDALGHRTGLPLVSLLGGAVRDRIAIYNTCGGPTYARETAMPNDLLRGTDDPGDQYEDLIAFETAPAQLAQSLLDMGISAMKIWPFDLIAMETRGQSITPAQLDEGLRPFAAIRDAVGDRMEIALELHAKWTLPAAKAIAKAAEAYRPMWIEDAMRVESLDALVELAESTSIPTVVSERLGNRFVFRDVLACGAAGIIMADPLWAGGVSETRRIAELAAAFLRPFTPHDCNGPVGLAVGVHLCLHHENALLQEFVRAFYYGWYNEVAQQLPPVDDGFISVLPVPGHGITLRDEIRDAAVVRVTE
jgi:galactonate dehydratase